MKKALIVLTMIIAILCLAGWERTYGGYGNDLASSVVLGHDGGYIITGIFDDGIWEVDTVIFGSDTLLDSTYVMQEKPFAMKIDESGDSVWFQTYDYSWHEYIWYYADPKIHQLPLSGYAIMFEDMVKFLLRIDNMGNELW
ncbi:MAG: hypothetical protein ACP5G4_06105, partial [bacterium]